MYCPNCGYQNRDSAVCLNCGTPLPAGDAQPIYQQSAVNPPYQQGGYSQSAPSSPGLAVLKKLCSSPVALIMAIALTASLLCSFVHSISSSDYLMRSLYQLAPTLDIPITDIYDFLQSSYIILVLISMIPGTLIAVGLWITYASAANRQNAAMKTSGLTMIKVVIIVTMVFECVLLGIGEISLIIAVAVLAGNADSYFYVGINPVPVLTAFIIIIALVLVLEIVYCVKFVKTINTIRMTARFGILSDKVSVFVAVMSFIFGGVNVLNLINVFNPVGFSYSILMILLSCSALLCSATFYIASGIFLISYRSKMRAVMYGSGYETLLRQPMYAVPGANVYAPPMQQPPVQPNGYYPQGAENDQPVTASGHAQQLVTCSNCGRQYDISQVQAYQCPYCGYQENADAGDT